jgi:YidC/Oxa1 family membrane protein insertase
MENRNFLLFITISIAILFIWSELYTKPIVEAEQERLAIEAERVAQQQALNPPQPSATMTGAVSASSGGSASGERPSLNDDGSVALRSRYEALSDPRIAFEGEALIGTISLRGGHIDDVTLKNHRVSIEEGAEQVILFNPDRVESAYYADFGWAASRSGGVKVPDRNSLWIPTRSGRLTPLNPMEIKWENGEGLTFRRLITIDDQFMFSITQSVENNSTTAVELYPYGRLSRFGLPELANFFILHEGFLGVYGGELNEEKYKNIDKDGTFTRSSTGGWLGITDKYWLAALIPDQENHFEGSYASHKSAGTDRYNATYMLDGVIVQPGGRSETTNRLFVGAKKNRTLTAYRDDEGVAGFDRAIDWGIFFFITKPIFSLLDYFGHLIGNFGVAILFVTIIIKLILFPLASKSYESMSRMKKLQPEMVALKDRFADDKQKQQQEIMELYRREKVNPLAGCLPMFVQIPVFFALYKVIFISIDLRQAPFFGWIQDLSAPDPTSILNLFGLLPYNPDGWPFVGEFLGIGIWPLLMGITMFLQMRMNPTPADPIQEKMFTFMPIIFTFMLARFPSGLVIYWAWNNFLSIAQQSYIMRKNGVEIELFKNLGLERFFPQKQTATASVETTQDKDEKP